jgi:hypothetical protein
MQHVDAIGLLDVVASEATPSRWTVLVPRSVQDAPRVSRADATHCYCYYKSGLNLI